MDQWRERLAAFLALPIGNIGQFGGGKGKRTGMIDVAVIQSLQRQAVVHDFVAEYGHVNGRRVPPDPSLFIYLYVRKEAVLSSQIEGTQSSFSDLMLFESAEAPGVPLEDVQEVSNYVAAMNHGLRRLREDFPLSLRLIREIHKILLSKGRGSEKRPGEFRETQNWIGGTRPGNAAFVPPPPEKLIDFMAPLETDLSPQHADL